MSKPIKTRAEVEKEFDEKSSDQVMQYLRDKKPNEKLDIHKWTSVFFFEAFAEVLEGIIGDNKIIRQRAKEAGWM